MKVVVSVRHVVKALGYADRVMKQVIKEDGRDGDVDLICDLASNFEWTTICPLATADAWPIKSFTGKFRSHFDAYIERKNTTKKANAI